MCSAIYLAWRMEGFWRNLPSSYRWEYKYLTLGIYAVCGALILATSYRLTYLDLVPSHLLLLGIFLLIGWAMMLYAALQHRLLNRKIFVRAGLKKLDRPEINLK
jgi:uncharacterized membrane protein YgdD (TMEM256/DUF423 family)